MSEKERVSSSSIVSSGSRAKDRDLVAREIDDLRFGALYYGGNHVLLGCSNATTLAISVKRPTATGAQDQEPQSTYARGHEDITRLLP
jgi:hypothetical protein